MNYIHMFMSIAFIATFLHGVHVNYSPSHTRYSLRGVAPCGRSGGTPSTNTAETDDYNGFDNTKTGNTQEHIAAAERPTFWLKRGEYTHLIYNFIAAVGKYKDDDADQGDDDAINTDFDDLAFDSP